MSALPLPFSERPGRSRLRLRAVAYGTALLLAASALVTGSAPAARAESVPDAPATTVGATLSGTVRSQAQSDVGVSAVVVDLLTLDGGIVKETATSQTGAYSFSDVAVGDYTLGFVPAKASGLAAQWWTGKTDLKQADLLSVTDATPQANLDAALVEAAPSTPAPTATPTPTATPAPTTTPTPTATATPTSTPTATPTATAAAGAALPSATLLETITAGATISGTVTGSDTATGLSSVLVSAYDTSSANGSSVSTTTDSDGKYSLSALPAGSYKLQFANARTYQAQWFSGKASQTAADVITVTAGATATGKNVVLAKGATISGQVTGADTASGLGSVSVFASDTNSTSGLYFNASTDTNGNYSLEGLPAASYKLQFSGSGQNYQSQWFSGKTSQAAADVVVVAASATITGKDVVLARGATISGKVTGPDAVTGLPSVTVNAYDAASTSGYSSLYASTDSNGNYSLSGLPAGSYKLQFSAYGQNYQSQWFSGKTSQANADVITIVAGAAATSKDVVLAKGATITGHVTASDALDGLSSVSVYAYDTSSTYGSSAYASTDSSGNYSLSGLPAGSYKLQFALYGQNYQSQWFSGKTSQDAADAVAVAAGATASGNDVVLAKGSTISGTVTGTGGLALQNVSVTAYGMGTGLNNNVGSVFTRSDGSYSVTGLAAGTYTLLFSTYGQNYQSQWWGGTTSQSTATRITIGTGATISGTDALLVAGSTISGSVHGEGSPTVSLQGVQVTANTTISGVGVSANASAMTDSNGNFTITGLPAGNYTLSYYFNASASMNYALPIPASAFTVGVGASVTGKDVVLARGSSISGTVQGEGNPKINLSGVSVSAAGTGTTYQYLTTTTAADGSYTLYGLSADTYSLRFYVTASAARNYAGAGLTGVVVAAATAVTGTNVVLQQGGYITGTVQGAGSPNVNLVGVQVSASSGTTGHGYSTTEADGTYAIYGLEAGSYTLFFSLQATASKNYVGTSLTDTVTVPAASLVAGKDIVLARGASISGIVQSSGTPNQPLASADVYAKPKDVSHSGSSAQTGADGSYTVFGLAAGSYALEFSRNYYNGTVADSYAVQWWNGKSFEADADAIDVAAGGTLTGKDVVMGKGGSVSGHVTDAAGKALANIDVLLYGSTSVGDQRVTGTSTDANGDYTAANLAAGSYKVAFTDYATGLSLDGSGGSGGIKYQNQFWDNQPTLAAATPVVVASGQVAGERNAVMQFKFSDVPATSTFATAISWMYNSGLSTGYAGAGGGTEFRPAAAVTRQAMAAFVFRYSKESFTPPSTPTFSDVPVSAPFFKEIEWMASKGISTGYDVAGGGKEFRPSAAVTRQAMASFLARFEGVTLGSVTSESFADVPVSHPFAAAIAWLKDAKISTGTAQPSGLPLYKPTDAVSRQAMSAFLFRLPPQ